VFGFGAVGKDSSYLVLVALELTVEVMYILLGLMYKHEIYQREILLWSLIISSVLYFYV